MLCSRASLLVGSLLGIAALTFLGAQLVVAWKTLLFLSKLSQKDPPSIFEEELRPMFASLPKNPRGELDPPTVRYALRRYFVQKYAWYVKGLEPETIMGITPSPMIVVRDRAPDALQSLLEKRLYGHWMDLRELAAFAAALTEFIHKEASTELHKVYDALYLPVLGPVPEVSFKKAIEGYFVGYLLEQDLAGVDSRQLEGYEKDLREMYPAWDSASMWANDLHHTYKFLQHSRRNPFVDDEEGFHDGALLVQELVDDLGSFHDLECSKMKNRLVEMEYPGTGRVPLSRFYTGGLKGDWTFAESADYLRNIGALDETNRKMPSVVIPNYITGPTNCLAGSGFYTVCCSNECDRIFGQLERTIKAPSAEAGRIAAAVAAIPSDTEDVPRELSSEVLAHLHEIAMLHDGQVPLHGQLFAHWMHHAYPRECPFPREPGTASPMTPEEWMKSKGRDNIDATRTDMQEYHDRELSASEAEAAIPWMDGLLTESPVVAPARWGTGSLRPVVFALALSSFAVALLRTWMASGVKVERKM